MALDANRNNYYCTNNHRSWQKLVKRLDQTRSNEPGKILQNRSWHNLEKYQTKPTVKESVKIIQN